MINFVFSWRVCGFQCHKRFPLYNCGVILCYPDVAKPNPTTATWTLVWRRRTTGKWKLNRAPIMRRVCGAVAIPNGPTIHLSKWHFCYFLPCHDNPIRRKSHKYNVKVSNTFSQIQIQHIKIYSHLTRYHNFGIKWGYWDVVPFLGGKFVIWLK